MNAETVVLRLYRRKRELEEAIRTDNRRTGPLDTPMTEEEQHGAIIVLAALVDELDAAIVADSK